MTYKLIEAVTADELSEKVAVAEGAGVVPVGGAVVVQADTFNKVRFYQTVATPTTGGANVNDGATIAVVNSAGADSHDGVATVAGVSLTNVKLAATVAMVDNTDTVAVVNSAGADSHNATAAVAAGVVTNLVLPATVAFVDNADTVTIQNSAGAAVAGSHTATVAAGVVSNVKLAATVAPVSNGAALTVPVTGTYATTATVSVANGVVTGIVLS